MTVLHLWPKKIQIPQSDVKVVLLLAFSVLVLMGITKYCDLTRGLWWMIVCKHRTPFCGMAPIHHKSEPRVSAEVMICLPPGGAMDSSVSAALMPKEQSMETLLMSLDQKSKPKR